MLCENTFISGFLFLFLKGQCGVGIVTTERNGEEKVHENVAYKFNDRQSTEVLRNKNHQMYARHNRNHPIDTGC